MAHTAQSRSRINRTTRIQIVLVCLVVSSILVARNNPPHFAAKPTAQSVLSSNTHHDQRLRFDHNGPQWNSRAPVVSPAPRNKQLADLPLSSPLFSSLQFAGFHYNRPPPRG